MFDGFDLERIDLGDVVLRCGDPLEVWRAWAPDLRGREVASGHHIAEEIPDILADELTAFLGPGG